MADIATPSVRPRIIWDGKTLAAVADITIDELDNVIARLAKLGVHLREQRGASIHQVPKPALIVPT